MQPDPGPILLAPGSAREQLEDYLGRVLRGEHAAKVKARILCLHDVAADEHAARVVEMCMRPYPVPGSSKPSSSPPAGAA